MIFFILISSLGLEIAPRVRFMKKGQKTENQEEPSINLEQKENGDNDDDDEDDDWFKVKSKPDALDSVDVELPEHSAKEKKLTKAKLAKKLRKKNLLINKRIEYDDDGNVQFLVFCFSCSILFALACLACR